VWHIASGTVEAVLYEGGVSGISLGPISVLGVIRQVAAVPERVTSGFWADKVKAR
jgi:hypothetical protein